MTEATKEILTAMLRIEEATLKAQRAFSLNTAVSYIQGSITEARIAAIKKELKK